MDKFQKVKLTLQKLLLQFGEVSTDKGLLEYTGEELVVGAEVFIDGNPAPDGEYKIAEDKVIVVADGKVAEIKEPAPAPEPEPEPAPEVPVEAATEEDLVKVIEPLVNEINAVKAELEAVKARLAEIESKLQEDAAKPAEEEFKTANKNSGFWPNYSRK